MAGEQFGLGLGADGLAPRLDQINSAQQIAQDGVVKFARCGVLDREKVVALMRSQGVTRAFWEDE